MKIALHTIGVALLVSLAGPGLAAVTVSATVPAVVAPVAAVLPVATVARERQAPGPQQPATEVSGGVLIGMAVCGLLIVGVEARRRSPDAASRPDLGRLRRVPPRRSSRRGGGIR